MTYGWLKGAPGRNARVPFVLGTFPREFCRSLRGDATGRRSDAVPYRISSVFLILDSEPTSSLMK